MKACGESRGAEDSSFRLHPSLPCARRRRCRLWVTERLEVHVGRLAGAWCAFEVRLRLEAAQVRHEVGGKLQHRGVELLGHLVVATPFDRDAILGPFELRLQLEE